MTPCSGHYERIRRAHKNLIGGGLNHIIATTCPPSLSLGRPPRSVEVVDALPYLCYSSLCHSWRPATSGRDYLNAKRVVLGQWRAPSLLRRIAAAVFTNKSDKGRVSGDVARTRPATSLIKREDDGVCRRVTARRGSRNVLCVATSPSPGSRERTMVFVGCLNDRIPWSRGSFHYQPYD